MSIKVDTILEVIWAFESHFFSFQKLSHTPKSEVNLSFKQSLMFLY